MSMTTEPMSYRQMMELAAKAIGWEVTDWVEVDGLRGAGVKTPDGRAFAWYPLDEDGDAFRLAVALGIDVYWCADAVQCGLPRSGRYYRQPFGGSKASAMRVAILRASAEIGRAMG